MPEGSTRLAVRLDPAAWEGTEIDVEALLAGWQVAAGERVAMGQEIGTAELVKASIAIVAPATGRIAELCVPVGDSFARNRVLAWIEPDA